MPPTAQEIEPGLQQSEEFYSLAFTAFFFGHTSSAIANGLLFNLIPTWYLFLAAVTTHTVGYLFYASASSGWMMLVARGLAGVSLGLVTSVSFTYFGVTYERYLENQKILGICSDKNKTEQIKGYIFSTLNNGILLGPPIGLGKY